MTRNDLVRFHFWNLVEDAGRWVLHMKYKVREAPFTEQEGYIAVMPATFPWELAVDAVCEWMDRLRLGRVRGIDTPAELMEECCKAARRQK